MMYEVKDFIGVFSNVFPENFCQHLIVEFERNQKLGMGADRISSDKAFRHIKDDYQIFVDDSISLNPFNNQDVIEMFFEGLQNCFEIYTEIFSTMKTVRIKCDQIKMQKTGNGEGYHVWHHEQGNGSDESNRSLVYTLYLNSLPKEANGETEFLYQQRRINPVENTMVLWPASFTHPHRGNPVYGDKYKYIVTGWFRNE